MGTLGVEVVPRAIEVHGQQINRVETILLAVCLGLHQEHLLGQAIRGIGLLRITVPEVLFPEWNGGELRVGAYGPQDHAFPDPGLSRRFYDLDPHDGVVVEELCRILLVEADAPDPGCQVDDDVLAVNRFPAVLPDPEIEVFAPRDRKLVVFHACPAELLNDCRPEEPGPTGEEDLFAVPESHSSLHILLSSGNLAPFPPVMSIFVPFQNLVAVSIAFIFIDQILISPRSTTSSQTALRVSHPLPRWGPPQTPGGLRQP